MKKIILIISLIFLFISCKSDLDPKEKTEPILPNDPILLGTWVGSLGVWSSYINTYEWHTTYLYSFEDNNLIQYSSTHREYGIITSEYDFTYEWKIENGKSYYKLYQNSFSDWKEFKIEKIDNNNIIIDGIKLSKS